MLADCLAAQRPARRRRVIVAFLAVLAGAAPAAAHESRPLYVELTETAAGDYRLQWKSPASVPASNLPVVTLSGGCTQVAPVAAPGPSAGMLRQTIYACPGGIAGQRLNIDYPRTNPTLSTLVGFHSAAGERHLAVLAPDDTTWIVPGLETMSGVARQYTLLGINHIWIGIDHLLFLACLMWVARTWKRILITITGFTLAHSATLVLSALELVRMPTPPVEATIALSIVFLAGEIARGPRQSLTWRYPVAVSTSFGLLHGFGFAAALSEIGLPQAELLAGLLSFNVGVEIGQVVFACVVISLMRLLLLLQKRWLGEMTDVTVYRTAAGYAIGALSSFWLIERCTAFWTAAA